MKSLFNESDNQEMVERISHLNSSSRAQWGKATLPQMLAHCQAPLQVAFGEMKLKRGLLGILFGNMAKKKLLSAAPFAKNLPTDKSFVIKNPEEFNREQLKLIALVQRFAKQGAAALTKDPHPFFGPLTPEEWDCLQYKHLDHHLSQFGV